MPVARSIVDTNAVFNEGGVESALQAGESPVVTQTTRAELSNLVASGKVGMPQFAGKLPTIPDLTNVDMRINIRAMLPGGRGLFGDGSICCCLPAGGSFSLPGWRTCGKTLAFSSSNQQTTAGPVSKVQLAQERQLPMAVDRARVAFSLTLEISMADGARVDRINTDGA